jgi:hypothetical protein
MRIGSIHNATANTYFRKLFCLGESRCLSGQNTQLQVTADISAYAISGTDSNVSTFLLYGTVTSSSPCSTRVFIEPRHIAEGKYCDLAQLCHQYSVLLLQLWLCTLSNWRYSLQAGCGWKNGPPDPGEETVKILYYVNWNLKEAKRWWLVACVNSWFIIITSVVYITYYIILYYIMRPSIF